MSLFVKRNLLGQLGHEMWTLRTWANETHLALQDVPELRDLVHAYLANDASDARRARVTLAGPNWSILFGVDSHRAKLCQHKRAAVLSYSVLFIEDWTTRFEFDQDSRQQNDWQRKNCANQRDQPVHRGARELRELRLSSATTEDQPRRAQHIQRNASGDAFVKRRAFFNRHVAGQTQLQQFVCR